MSEATRPSELNSHRSVRNTLVFITGVRDFFCRADLTLSPDKRNPYPGRNGTRPFPTMRNRDDMAAFPYENLTHFVDPGAIEK